MSSYIDGELGPAARRSLEAHLARFATCPPLYQALVATTIPLGKLHDPDSVIPADLAGRVRHYLDRAKPNVKRAPG